MTACLTQTAQALRFSDYYGTVTFFWVFLRVYERKNRWSAPQKWTSMISTYNLGGACFNSSRFCDWVVWMYQFMLFTYSRASESSLSFCLRIELLWTFTCRFLCAHNFLKYAFISLLPLSLRQSLKSWSSNFLVFLNSNSRYNSITGKRHSGTESASQCGRCKRRGFSPWIGKIPWSKKWQPTPVFLPGKFHGQRNLEGYSLWGLKESDTTEWMSMRCVIPPLAMIC